MRNIAKMSIRGVGELPEFSVCILLPFILLIYNYKPVYLIQLSIRHTGRIHIHKSKFSKTNTEIKL